MRAVSSLKQLNPFRILPSRYPFSKSSDHSPIPVYERLSNGSIDATNGPNAANGFASGLLKGKPGRFLPTTALPQPLRSRKSMLRIFCTTIIVIVLLVGLTTWDTTYVEAEGDASPSEEVNELEFFWQIFPRLNGFYNGVKTLVPYESFVPEAGQNTSYVEAPFSRNSYSRTAHTKRADHNTEAATPLPLSPQIVNPYPKYQTDEYLRTYSPVHECFLDVNETKRTPEVVAYPGLPQHGSQPFFGGYDVLRLSNNICWERFGRLGPYGYGYGAEEGGLGLGAKSERQGTDEIWRLQPKVNWKDVDWGAAQKKCYAKNVDRFTDHLNGIEENFHAPPVPGQRRKLPRTAYVFRAWTGFEFTPHEILYLRSMITELALKSGGEYDVHILMHVRDEDIPIWASTEVYQSVIENNVPREFWGITTLWNIPLMKSYYPDPFPENFENPSQGDIHGVYRSAHFPLQWFSQQYPEYDFVWNWEMDIRYSGHHYEFHEGVVDFARRTPRKGLWERNAKFWIPSYHGNYTNFTNFVMEETLDRGEVPVWGPVSFPNSGRLEPPPETNPPRSFFDDKFEWGVGEEADLITFNPIFDPAKTLWVFRNDITGYDTKLPVPPRRCAIVTVARLSRRMLDIMHKETYKFRHSGFPEMWPPTVALHHGLKAVYAPHPVFFDRKWPLEHIDQTFNYPKNEDASVFTPHTVFGWGEHNWLGSSFYYNSGFSGALWRRWLGERENNEGGAAYEREGTGRMCLRSILHHPIKKEDLPTD